MKKILTAALITTTAACTWVKPSPQAAHIQLLSATQVQSCQRLGSAGAKGVSKVGIFVRKDEKVRAELANLARDEAHKMGGDSIVAESELSADGAMDFGVYRCR